MAIFAKRQGQGKGGGKFTGAGAAESSRAVGDLVVDVSGGARGAGEAAPREEPRPSEAEQQQFTITEVVAAAQPVSGPLAVDRDGDGDGDGQGEQVVAPAVVEPGVSTTPVVASGVIQPAVVDTVDIEPEVIEPEAIEPEPIATPAFGIADAIRLMRSLPADPNIDLVVRVVRVTLGAVNVSVEDIMQDAARKEKSIQGSIAALQSEVEELEKQLYAKRCEIAAHEADLKETVTVRERLHMADKYAGHRPPPTPPDAAKNAHPKPSEWAAEWERSEQAKANQAKT